MEMTISGVSVKLTADEIISALLSEEGKGLWELKRKLDHLEAEIMEVDFEETGEQISAKIMPEIEDLLQSDTELPPSPKKSPTVKKKRRRRRINPKTGKRYYHRKIKKTKFVEAKNHKPIINDEDSPAIPPAKRPNSRSIELNV